MKPATIRWDGLTMSRRELEKLGFDALCRMAVNMTLLPDADRREAEDKLALLMCEAQAEPSISYASGLELIRYIQSALDPTTHARMRQVKLAGDQTRLGAEHAQNLARDGKRPYRVRCSRCKRKPGSRKLNGGSDLQRTFLRAKKQGRLPRCMEQSS